MTMSLLRNGKMQFREASMELEHKAFQLALAGDSNLITFMLRCHKPEVYRDTQRHEVGLLGGIVLLPAKQSGPE
jgi:hypothetical protein